MLNYPILWIASICSFVYTTEYSREAIIKVMHPPCIGIGNFLQDSRYFLSLLGNSNASLLIQSLINDFNDDNGTSKCFLNDYYEKNVNIVLLRNPIDHVYSQYLENKYDKNFVKQRNIGNFPSDFSDERGFEIWLNYFELTAWGTLYVGDFGYNPINMQTRYMTCIDESHHWDIDTSFPELTNLRLPSHRRAQENLHSVDLVGIIEFYPSFLCIYIYRTTKILPSICKCNGDTGPNISNIFNVTNLDISRSVESKVLDKIYKLTERDQQIYKRALQIFLEEVMKVEKETSAKILCTGFKNYWEERFKYLDLHL